MQIIHLYFQEAKELIKKSVSLWLPKVQTSNTANVDDAEFDAVEVCIEHTLKKISLVTLLKCNYLYLGQMFFSLIYLVFFVF